MGHEGTAVAFTMVGSSRKLLCKWSIWIHLLVFILILPNIEGLVVNITYMEDAVRKGAVCLDGSPPAYHLSRGFGAGVNNWLVNLEGGGWCQNVTDCLVRKKTGLGSSKKMATQRSFSGILSNDKSLNPDFYNWNRISVRYCDGSSFTGDVEEVDPATNLHYRGARVWIAVIEDLLARGMSKAENALQSGTSAGGLASIFHCDRFQSLFQKGVNVKCLSDAGFFVNVNDVTGKKHIEAYYNDVVKTHGSARNIPSCNSGLTPSMCFFPQYAVPSIQTPLFILNAAYDSWQIAHILVPSIADPNGAWKNCKSNLQQCSSTQLQAIQDFRVEFLDALASIGSSSSRGTFINSCYTHGQSYFQESWLGPNSPVLKNTTIAEAVGNWFYDRSSFQEIEHCPYPCDTFCYNFVSGGDGGRRTFPIHYHGYSDS